MAESDRDSEWQTPASGQGPAWKRLPGHLQLRRRIERGRDVVARFCEAAARGDGQVEFATSSASARRRSRDERNVGLSRFTDSAPDAHLARALQECVGKHAQTPITASSNLSPPKNTTGVV